MNQQTKLLIFSAAFIATTMLTGCNNSPDSTVNILPASGVGTEVYDAEVTRNVKTALKLDEKAKNLNITVATLKGDVKLTGVVDNQSQIDYVNQLVRSVQGVHTLHDELSIKR